MKLHTTRWEPVKGWSSPLPDCDSPATLVLAFSAARLDVEKRRPLRDLLTAYPTSLVVGCSTAGEIMADALFRNSMIVAVASFDATRISAVHERVGNPGQSYDAGVTLGKRLMEREPGTQAVFVLSDGLVVNASKLLAGLVDGTNRGVMIAGGLAGDEEHFERTWVLADGEPRPGHVTAVGFSGERFRMGTGSRGGWDIFGPERRVTRSDGNVLFELDGQPALRLYRKYLGQRAAGLPATALLFPLAVRVPGAPARQTVRTILALDDEAQSMTFAGDIPEGSLAQLMKANFDRLIDGAHLAAADAAVAAPHTSLAVAVSCVGRRLLLGRRTEDELDAVRSALPADTELVGFYSYGEISSVAPGISDLHNQSMTVATFEESA